ncbi:contact-dependent growth inhibition system immunity protein [Streptomyces sp. NBC_01619]|uniref:contact-dependent growth inhibition system immunity protein n=1 Tax=unclassified Streptomyces TaxID=2593676 RepID=UPI0022574379|nr:MULTISPECIES: contact-dependent growth inhibition system immunity protein [unclassified Streptomyces]MCX4511495.1 contact-dependent growth inhibition system immunity protein [Streptomyces sp. NBC_01619]
MNSTLDRQRSLEELEGHRWPEPPPDATGLVKAVHALRALPIGSLTVEELRRLIGQNVGVPFLLPLALESLRKTAPAQAEGGFYDDDLLSAVLTVNPAAWTRSPQFAQELKCIVASLRDVSPYIESDIQAFQRALPDDL